MINRTFSPYLEWDLQEVSFSSIFRISDSSVNSQVIDILSLILYGMGSRSGVLVA